MSGGCGCERRRQKSAGDNAVRQGISGAQDGGHPCGGSKYVRREIQLGGGSGGAEERTGREVKKQTREITLTRWSEPRPWCLGAAAQMVTRQRCGRSRGARGRTAPESEYLAGSPVDGSRGSLNQA